MIAPEIPGDKFHAAISWLSEHEKLDSVLEIGSSAGDGSTSAFVDGLSRNSNRPSLYCMELSVPRFHKLRKTYAAFEFVKCYNVSSVPLDRFPTETEVTMVYRTQRTALNQWPLESVLEWLRQDIKYVRSSDVPRSEEHTSELQSHLNLVC